MFIPEMTRGPGLETLKVWAGELTTFTLLNVPEILILCRRSVNQKKKPGLGDGNYILHHRARLSHATVRALTILSIKNERAVYLN